MRPRTFAREIAFQVLYRDDLNPKPPEAVTVYGDALLDQGRQTLELTEFVRHLADLRDQEDAHAGDEVDLYRQWLRTPSLVEFSRLLIQGVVARQKELDETITSAAENWSVPRMAATDRNLLRLGVYEIQFTDTPVKVVIDEAVELAKRFGGAQSAQFVNGILDKLMHQRENTKSEISNPKQIQSTKQE